MRQLILKDFVVQKRSMPIYLLLGFVFFLFYYSMGDLNITAIVMPVFIIAYSFMNRSLAEDDRNHTIRLIVSLPLHRMQIVKAKYASIALVVFPVFVVFGLLGKALGLGIPDLDKDVGDPEGAALIFLVMSFFLLAFIVLISVYLPLVYKIGFVRAQAINRFVVVFTIALGAAAGILLTRVAANYGGDGPPEWVKGVIAFIEGLNLYVLSMMILFLTIVIYLLSMLLSIRFFERHQLF
ncbi:MAG: ABC-2 transporter permease [Gorillibacterium sp.]|nr:ABC-2 transporter permease [Gorillibacterium sp.]